MVKDRHSWHFIGIHLTNIQILNIIFGQSGYGEVWYRAWFGSKRPRVRIPILRPNKKVHLQRWTFLFGWAEGFERALRKHAGGMFLARGRILWFLDAPLVGVDRNQICVILETVSFHSDQAERLEAKLLQAFHYLGTIRKYYRNRWLPESLPAALRCAG